MVSPLRPYQLNRGDATLKVKNDVFLPVEGPPHPAYHLASPLTRRENVTKRSFAPAATLLAVLAWPAAAGAQDAHYWTYGYGPVGQLTEGTLVGGVNDLSAVFYNPGPSPSSTSRAS